MDKNIEKIIIKKLKLQNINDIKISEKVKTFDVGKNHNDYEIHIQIKFKREGRSESIKIELQFQSINDLISWIIEE